MAWSVLQVNATAGHATGGSATITSTTAGSLLIVLVNMDLLGVVSSVTNGGDTFVSAGQVTTLGTHNAEIWYAENIGSGRTSIVVNFSGGDANAEYFWYEVSGIATSSSFDNATQTSTQGPSPIPVGSALTTAEVNEFIVCWLGDAGAVTNIKAGNEFTNDKILNGNGWAHITSTTATAASHQAQWDSSNSLYQSITAAFKSAAASTRRQPQLMMMGTG